MTTAEVNLNPEMVELVKHFVNQRHKAFLGEPVEDDIVRTRKFTNVFRVLDRGSQYLLQLMNEYGMDELEDRLALSYFYRQVNRPDTMDAIIEQNDGYIPTFEDITNPLWYDKVVTPVAARREGEFLNGAYIILIKPGYKAGTIAKMREMFPGAHDYLAETARVMELEDRVSHIHKTPGVGPFLAMQIATDMGYCEGEEDQENDFVLDGPGSRRGAKYVADVPAELVIDAFPYEELPTLPGSNGRPPSLMDMQKVFHEFNKYMKYRGYTYVANMPATYKRKPPYEISIPSHFVEK